MKNRMTKNIKLNKNEEILSKAVEDGEFIKVSDEKDEISRLTNIFKSSSSKSVNIRLDENVLVEIRARAKASGMPYQTLIKTVLYQYANNKLSVAL